MLQKSGSQSVTITITDNETTAPKVTLTSSASSIAENSGSSITLTATLSVATTADVTVGLSKDSGAATEGTDFNNLSDITVTAGNTTGTTSFTPTNDSIYDAASNETAVIIIDSVSGGSATEDGSQSVTLTITDDESAPTVSLSTSVTSTVAEKVTGGSITITATASVATFANISVPVTMSGTATEGTDYNSGGTVSDITISAGSTSGTATLTPVDDTLN